MRRLIAILILLLTSTIVRSEQYAHHFSVARGSDGVALNAATVSVYLAGTNTLAQLYGNDAGTPKGNPFITDAQGNYDFFVVPGSYKITVTKIGVGSTTIDKVQIGTAIHSPTHSTAGTDPLTLSAISGELPDAQKIAVQESGSLVGTRTKINLVDSATVGISASDNVPNSRVNIQADIEANSLTDTHLAENSVGASELGVDAVTNENVSASAAIAESKLSLNFPTHSNANDPSSGQKLALVGTFGTPSNTNKYITNSDPRNSDARSPTIHAASHTDGGSDEIVVVVPQQLSGVNGGTDLASDLEEETHSTEHQNGGSDEISVSGLSGILADGQRVVVRKDGSVVGTRPTINFNEGGGTVLTVVDNPGQDRVDVQIDSTSASDASSTVKGISKLSVDPASAINPIAVGDNDSRMTNSRTPTGAASGDLSGTYPSPAVVDDSHNHTSSTLSGVLPLAGGTMAGNVDMDGNLILMDSLYTMPAYGVPAPVRIQASGGTGTDATHEGTRQSLFSLVDTRLTQPQGTAMMIDIIQTSNPNPLDTITRTGLHVKAYTLEDNGGDSSGILVAQSGGGSGITVYKSHQLRPVGFPDLAMNAQGALEVGTSDANFAALFSAGSDFGGPSPYRSHAIQVRLGHSTGSSQSDGIIINGDDSVYDDRNALVVGQGNPNAAPSNVQFRLQLDGDTYFREASTTPVWIDSSGVRVFNNVNDASSPAFTLYKSRLGGSVATNEAVGDIGWVFDNSSGAQIQAGLIRGMAADKTASTEDMDFHFYQVRGGSLTDSVVFRSTGKIEATTPTTADPSTTLTTRAYVDKTATGWYNVKSYGAIGDGAADDTSAIDVAVSSVIASPTGGVLYFPAGSYIYNGAGIDLASTVTTKGLRVVGDGPMASYLTFTGCSNTYCLDIRNTNLIGSGQNGSGIQEITVAGVTTENLIRLKNLEAWNISNITTLNGLTALTVEECRLGQASNLYLKGFNTHGVNVIGNSATQSNLYSDVMMISDPAATGNGFNYAITSAGSAGTYLNRVGISLAGAGAAFNVEATTGGTPIYFFCTDCVADGSFPGGAFKMKNVNHVYFENTWSVNHATGSSALELDNVEYGAWVGGHLYALTGNAATGVNLKNGVDNFTLSSTNIHGNDYAISSDGNTNSVSLDNVFKTSFDTALVNDFTKLSKAATSYSSAFTLLGGTGTSNLLGFKNPSSSTLSYMGQNSSGNLEFLATNGSTVTGRVLNSGGWQSSVMSQVPGIKDADGDTGLEIERTADNDILYFKTAGTDRIVTDQNGTTTILQPGNSSSTFTTSTAQLANIANDGSPYTLTFSKSRSGGSVITNEIVGDISWVFVNSTPAAVAGGVFRAIAADKTAGSEDMDLQLYLVRAGVLTNSIFLRSTGLIETLTPSKSDVATTVITRGYEDTVTAVTVSDNGNGGTAAAATLTPVTKQYEYTCSDAQGCDITWSETGAVTGYRVNVINMGTNTINMADTAGVTELAGAFAMGQYDSITLAYHVDRWVEVGRSNN